MTTSNEHPSTPRDPVEIIGPVRRIEGCAYGFGQPALLLSLGVQVSTGGPEGPVSLAVSEALELEPLQQDSPAGLAILQRTLQWAVALQVKAGLPVFEKALTVPRGDQVHTVVLPCLMHSSGLFALQGAVRLVNQSLAVDGAAQEAAVPRQLGQLTALVSELARTAPRGFNTLHFLRAARELDVPWSHLGESVFQVGWGSRSRWLLSSFTDATPKISAGLARDKMRAATILRAGGLPVPPHAAAQNEDEAVLHAQELGYPVVVKPANRDGGVGVAARLELPEAVRTAYAAARRHSEHVLVEKHVEGRDYRLHVVGDDVLGVLERVPGGVTGDGVHSVRVLLEQQNLARKTATDDRRYLKQMQFDEEARRMLAALGLDASYVPVPGQIVRLRAMANVASGGVPVPVDLAFVHLDNLELALRAVRLLRLDVAGVDLLIPDITRSWMETGAAICEVNAQPQMFTTLHKPMLRSLLGGRNGRIPVLVALGAASAGKVAAAVHAGLDSSECTAGIVGSEGVWISRQCIARGPVSMLQGGRMLLCDRKVDAVVLSFASDRALPEGGWPVDRCDVVVLAGTTPKFPEDRTVLGAWLEALRMLRPRSVVASADVLQTLKQYGLNLPREIDVRIVDGTDVSGLAKASLEALLAGEA